MKTKIFYVAAFLITVSLFLTFGKFSNRMQAQEDSVETGQTAPTTDDQIAEKEPTAAFEDVFAKAARIGAVRVIVEFNSEFRPEGDITSAREIKRQRDDIKRAQTELLASLKTNRVAGVKRFDYIPFLALEADAATLEILRNSPSVVSIKEDRLVKPSIQESVPVVGATGGVANGFSGAGQTIAVLDTGVDKTHPYFADGKVVSEACYSTTTGNNPDPDSSQSLCPGGAAESTAPDSALNCDTSQIGVCWHGTHVAGIAAGRDLTRNHFGVAKDASIIAVQVFSRFNNPADCNGAAPCINGYNSDIIKGLERVYALRTSFNIASVNMSFGDGLFSNYCDGEDAAVTAAINNLRSVNIASVIASGNNGSTSNINWPACISTAVSVGSTNDGSNFTTVNTINNFSNSAEILSLYAPGLSIISASPGNQLRSTGGTSMAAPHVAGAWASLKQQNPSATVTQILTALTTTGRVITDPRAGANSRKTPRIRVDSASQQLAGTNCARVPISNNQFIDATLDAGDCAAESGVNRDLYAFEGTAGMQIAILMTSPQFDTFLYLLDPRGRVIATDDNNGGGTNSRIPASGNLILPMTGSYTILASKTGSSFAPLIPQNGNYQIVMLAPTAAGAAVSGRVIADSGQGIANARVFVTDQTGETKSVLTNSFGFYRFENLAAGAVYVFDVKHKRFSFAPRVVTISEDLSELNFTPES